MEGKSRLTKELVAQEARFVLDNLLTAAKYSPQVPYEELRRLAEPSLSLRLLDYLGFLERFGYVTYDRAAHLVNITTDGERVVTGEKMAELVIDVVHHFRSILARPRPREEPPASGLPAGGRRASTPASDRVDDRYEKLRVLGSGGIGTVYLSRQVMLDREVALKEVRELFGFFTEPQRQEIVRRFDDEVRRAARLSHPNIAAILDGNTAREYPYVVTDFVQGGNLRRVLKYAKTVPPELCVKVLLQLLHALSHAHGKRVIHRGLKPENILFDGSGNVRVTDFGMARVVERDQAVIQHVYIGMGSVAYMAPELFSDPTKVGIQTDLYALGITFYEMLARKLPGRRSPMPTRLHPTLPKIVDDLFDRLTQDDAAERYTSADDALDEFYKADASKNFLEPRGAVLFLQSPLERLEMLVPADEQGDADVGAGAGDELEREEAELGAGEGGGLEGIPSGGLSAMASTEYLSDDGGDEGDDRPRRRGRAQRPYSFQQRIKEREK
ncbi:MAG: serine/threonine protein kinase [Deltaproteobacteria bacterium]|nr:serine/threonine protein kinase [Deltaproteobacteria bacterium]